MKYIMNKIRDRSRSPTGYSVKISNLPLSFPQPRLFSMFSKFGDVKKIHLNLPEATVTLKSQASAKEAITCLSHQGWAVMFSQRSKSYIKANFCKSNFPILCVTLKTIAGDNLPSNLTELNITDKVAEPLFEKSNGLIAISVNDKKEESFIKVYIEYLTKNNKFGYASLGNDYLIILPPGKYSDFHYPHLDSNQLLGLYFKRQISKSMKLLQEFLENKTNERN